MYTPHVQDSLDSVNDHPNQARSADEVKLQKTRFLRKRISLILILYLWIGNIFGPNWSFIRLSLFICPDYQNHISKFFISIEYGNIQQKIHHDFWRTGWYPLKLVFVWAKRNFWFRNWPILERGLNFQNFRSWILSQNPFLDVNTQIYIFCHVTGYLTGSDLLLLKFHFRTDEIFNFFFRSFVKSLVLVKCFILEIK